MKTFIATLRPACISLFLLTLLLGIIYPLVMWGIGDLFFQHQANGSLILRENKVIGSSLIAQNFITPQYFHPRPSAAGDQGFDAANSSGSNLGPTSQKLDTAIRERILQYQAENSLAPETKIPADAVTSSGSGLDPHISLQNALLQASRIAKARNLTIEQIQALIKKHTLTRSLFLFGEPRVNVLELNLALDSLN